jgi:glycosyltransferase involved in cell wall biosynthesis
LPETQNGPKPGSINAVIDFDGGVPDGAKPVGIDVATREFLRAFFRFASQPTFPTLTPDSLSHATFRALAAEENLAAERCHSIAGLDDPALADAGLLVRYDPAIAQHAWRRRRHGQRRYSLTGLVHASASSQAREAIGALASAPLQSWDALICPSNAIKGAVETILEGWREYLADRLGVERARASRLSLQLPVIPLGVDTTRFDKITTPDKRSLQRTALGLSDDATAILYVGRLNYLAKANPLPLLLAVEDVARRRNPVPVHLLFNGYFNDDDNEHAFTEAIAAICKFAQVRIVRHGDPDFPDGLWAAADVFCSPVDNIQESFGLSPIEAMAAGVPAVISDWDGYRDTVRNQIDGFLIPTLAPPSGSGVQLAYDHFAGRAHYGDYLGAASQSSVVDTEALSRALFTLSANPDLRREMGASARRRAKETFEWSRIVRDYISLWTDLAERRAKDAEIGAMGNSAAFHPSHPDPFAMFAGFATARIELAGRLELAGLGWDEAMRRIRLKIGYIYPHTLIALEDLPLLIGQLESVGAATIEDLAGMLKMADTAKLARTAGWLVKLGICRYRAPE